MDNSLNLDSSDVLLHYQESRDSEQNDFTDSLKLHSYMQTSHEGPALFRSFYSVFAIQWKLT